LFASLASLRFSTPNQNSPWGEFWLCCGGLGQKELERNRRLHFWGLWVNQVFK